MKGIIWNMNYDALLITVTEIGFQLLKNGAETYRVEDSVTHVLKAYNDDIKDINVFAIPTSLIVSFTTKDNITHTKTKRVLNRLQNIDRIVRINSLCRYICKNKPSIDYIDEQLQIIENLKRYPFYLELAANSMAASGFTIFYGGGLIEAIVAVFIGALLKYTNTGMKKFKLNSFTGITINSFLIAFLAYTAFRLGITRQYDSVIIGCFMLLVPGVAITNAARDFIAGDVLSGTIRISEAILVATSIALGSGIALSIFR